MKVAMVKHKPYGKVFWFEIPEHFVGKLQPGFRVACNTARGRRYGTVVAADLDEQDVREVMLASGATFPLSTIEATTQSVAIHFVRGAVCALWSDHHVHVELVRCPARASHDWPGTSAGA